MNISVLNNNERAASGFTHAFEIDYTDLTSTAATSLVQTLMTALAAGVGCYRAGFRLDTPFDGGATSELTIQLGHDLASGTDDPDGFIAATSVHLDATEILFQAGQGALYNQASGVIPAVAWDLELTWTATGANLTELTAGKITIFVTLCDLNRLSRRYVAGL